MGPEFYQTVMGKKFFESQLPNLIKSINRLADIKEEELKYLRKPKINFTCSGCNKNIEVEWNTKSQGYKVYCPQCGAKNMLCDACQDKDNPESESIPCDYDKKTNSCRNNPPSSSCTLCDWCKGDK